MKAWLKGGLIGILVFILLVISDWYPFAEFTNFSIESLCIFITGCIAERCILCGMIFLVLIPFIFFLFGTLIGFIIGKIKEKKS